MVCAPNDKCGRINILFTRFVIKVVALDAICKFYEILTFCNGEQRGTIFYCHQRGDSYRKIAKTVGCGLMTVCNMLKRHAETGSTESKACSGRPRLIESNAREGLKKLVMAESNRRLCLSEI